MNAPYPRSTGSGSHPRTPIVAILASAGADGADPLAATLEPFKRGRRWYWGIRHGQRLIETPHPRADEERAKMELALFKRRELLRTAGLDEMPGQQLFRDVLKEMIDAYKEVPGRERMVAVYETHAVSLIEFFGHLRLIDYRREMSDAFVAEHVRGRKEHYVAHPTDPRDPATTARHRLRSLKHLVEAYAERKDTGWFPAIRIPKKARRDDGIDRSLPRWAIARLLRACRGWQWDPETDAWKTRPCIRADGTPGITRVVLTRETIVARYGVSRAIRIEYRVGGRKDTTLSAVWGRHTKLPSFDVDDDGFGTYYRRGSRVPRTNKGSEPSPVPAILAWLLAIWKRADGRSARSPKWIVPKDYVVRNTNGGPYRSYCFRSLFDDAGLDESYWYHQLKVSAWRFAHQAGLTVNQAAEITATEPDTLNKHYADWGPNGSDATARQAYDARATRLRFRKAPAGSGAEPRPARPDDRTKRYDRPFRRRSKTASPSGNDGRTSGAGP